MLDLIRHYQLDIMLMLGSVCLALAYLLAISKTLAPQRKRALLLLEINSAALLVVGRFSF